MAERTVADHQFKFSGGHAVVALIAIGALVLFRLAGMGNGLANEALVQAVTQQLQSEYVPDQVEAMRQALVTGDAAQRGQAATTLVNTRLNLHELRTSAPLLSFSNHREVIVKVAFSVDGTGGAGAAGTRYYRYQHGSIGNTWRYLRDASAYRYYANFF